MLTFIRPTDLFCLAFAPTLLMWTRSCPSSSCESLDVDAVLRLEDALSPAYATISSLSSVLTTPSRSTLPQASNSLPL